MTTEPATDEYRMTELGPLPPEWRVVRLGEVILQIFGGGTPSTTNPDFWGGNIPWTTSATIHEHDIELHSYQRTITEAGLRGSSTAIAPKGSLLVGTRVGVGKSVVTTFDVAISQDLTALVLNKQLIDAYFLAYLFKESYYQSWFENNKRGATIKGIPRQDLCRISLPLPPLAEQRAIAHTLRAVQQAKERTEGVATALRALKQSLMHHLFRYGPVPITERERVPLHETELGPLPAHWKVVRLGRVASIGQVRAKRKEQSLIPFIPMSLMPTNGIHISNWELRTPEEIRSGIMISEGDFLLAKITPCLENGKQGIIKGIPGGWGYATTEVFSIHPGNELIVEFLAFFLVQSQIRQSLAAKMEGATGRQRLPKSVLQSFPLPLPPRAEQCRIAAILQAVDRRIAAEEARARALGDLFTTLLHELMTARRRLPAALVAQFQE